MHTATTEIYTLSLHDALPISSSLRSLFTDGRNINAGKRERHFQQVQGDRLPFAALALNGRRSDRKSTRLNSSHSQISYAVFCLKKKKKSTTLTVTHAIARHHS